MVSFKDISKNEINTDNYNILIVSTTEVETKAFHQVMPDLITRLVCGDYTYYLGQVGQYNVVHVQCLQMGSLNPGGSSQTISKALIEWPQIKAVIMIGICYGFDEFKQQIGDVVVSTSVKNYEIRRVGAKKEIPRGLAYQSDLCLFNAFNNLKFSWENIGIDGQKKNLITGECVSAEKLVDNKKFRDKILKEIPEAKAGEMEGNGMVAACVPTRVPWILVKAICDFADGNKNKDKKEKQKIAAASSAFCCAAVLEQTTAFESIEIYPIRAQVSSIMKENYDVLFELYKKEYEPYFLHRDIDTMVKSYLSCHSLWIYGISGAGKSTSISHALLSMGKSILLINMAGINPNCSLVDIFEWIYNDIAAKVGENATIPNTYQLYIKKIIALLDNHYSNQSVYLLVEEIPFSGEVFKTFVSSFSSLVVSDKLTGTSADVHFVLSSIENPIPHVPSHLQKIKSMIKFLEFDIWTNKECVSLIELIKKNITIPNIQDIDNFISKCGFLPRPIKSVFRELYQTNYNGELDSNMINTLLTRL